jgi:hypothetical protein
MSGGGEGPPLQSKEASLQKPRACLGKVETGFPKKTILKQKDTATI